MERKSEKSMYLGYVALLAKRMYNKYQKTHSWLAKGLLEERR